MTKLHQPLLARLQHRFSPRRIRLGVEQSQVIEEGGASWREFQVPRELCLFLSVDLAGVQAKQRESLVRMAVKRAAPFADPAHEVAWQSDRAAVWYWSASRVEGMAGGLGRRDRVVAESLRLGQPHDDGAQLVALPTGLEGRLWRGGALIASRWWASQPMEGEWATFVRGAGFDAATLPMPKPIAGIRQAHPWQSRDLAGLKRLAEGASAFLPQAKQYVLYAIVLAFGWQLGGSLHAFGRLHLAHHGMAELTTTLEPILSARSQADTDLQAIDELLSLRPPSSQLMLLAEASRLMENSGWRVILWTQPNEDTIEVRFRAPQVDVEAVVSMWEASPWFESVTPALDPLGTSMTLQARLTVRNEPVANAQQSEPDA